MVTIAQIAQWLGLEETDTRSLRNFATDSRSTLTEGLYIPIQGARVDGHSFIEGAVAQGAIATLWKKGIPLPELDITVLEVEDPLNALQVIAQRYLQQVAPKVIAITGSNGKTSTKDMIESVLKQSFRTHKTAGNFNSDIGMPLTILMMPNETEVAVLEMGMNGFGDIELLSNLAEPDIALVTNIGESHAEQVGGRSGIARAKLEIRSGLKPNGHLFVDGDEPLLGEVPAERIGYHATNTYIIEQAEATFIGTTFKFDGATFNLPVLGKHQIRNAAYAIATARALGLTDEVIQAGLNEVQLTPMRMERLMYGQTAIINDAYNASPTSMNAAIETVATLDGFTNKVVVLGDMYELGQQERLLHASVGKKIALPVSHAILVGGKGRYIADGIVDPTVQVQFADTVEDAARLLQPLLGKQTVVLLKASRGLALEQIFTYLNET
ncbi:UDP-N-acetylmuramoyl-tripeptide--D-alanyl-D-alanine ligase [Exiguobacterium sp. Helios]|uniref:UDP-N-acetylmuramoyl-tripeptide--D-alanyl-D- alanine ligase n=1 Tax=unclassified Exiguobacterium TaxID=2644629 RepID=UPI00165D8F1A|nr:UDP-N-acetylmuramoyl-tripeptide--D-alanyl-D-alanine ligase [Exiguobacterium sp. Helios]QNR21555.1 UDP-N-acetylmuramoyl-tripeptide--D-alanyl-D-alanine ligase [Exiguobacterium sp. Helios]